MPVLGEEQWAGLRRHLEPAVQALLPEARELISPHRDKFEMEGMQWLRTKRNSSHP